MTRAQLETLSFDNTYARLPEAFYSKLNPTPFSEPPHLVSFNPLAAKLIDLDPEQAKRPEFAGCVWREHARARHGTAGDALLWASVWGLCPAAGGRARNPPWGSTKRTGREVGSASERCGAYAVLARGRWPCGSAFDHPGVSLQRSHAWAWHSDDSCALSRRERPPGLSRAGRNRRDARSDGAVPCALRHF